MARGASDNQRGVPAEGRATAADGAGLAAVAPAAPARPRRGRAARPSRWKHPEGIPLEEVEIGGYYAGIVTNCGPCGVFVNFGAVKDGLLKVPPKAGRAFKRGTELHDLCVLTCDPSTERVLLQPDKHSLPALATPRSPAPAVTAGRGRSEARSSSAPAAVGATRSRTGVTDGRRRQQAAGEEDRVPLEEVEPGSIVDGKVRNVGRFGVFLDIGAAGDARLLIPTWLGRACYRRGDIIKDCHVDWVDVELRRIQVSIEELPEAPGQAALAARAPPARTPAAVPTFRPAPASAPASGKTVPLEAIQVGSLVDGYVRKRAASGVFIDIGCGTDAHLDLPRKLASQFQRGDEVLGMLVEKVDVERGWIHVSLDDPELAVVDEVEPRPKASASNGATAKPKPATTPLAARSRTAPGLAVGDCINGVVTRIGPAFVYVDVGMATDARLAVPRVIAKQFQSGDHVHGMLVERIDPRTGVPSLSLEEPQLDVEDSGRAAVAGRESAATGVGPVASGRGRPATATARPPQQAKPRQKPREGAMVDLSRSTPLEDIEVGTQVSGWVTRLGPAGVFLDFGAARDGRLRVSREDAKKFQVGDQVEGMIVHSVNLEREEVTLALTYKLADEPIETVVPTPSRNSQASAVRRGAGGANAGSDAGKWAW